MQSLYAIFDAMRVHLVSTIAFAPIAIAACHSATAPASQTAHALALHFDSLYDANCGRGGGLAVMPQCQFIAAADLGVINGVLPSSIQVTTNGHTAQWLGYVLLLPWTDRAGMVDSSYEITAYDGLDVESGIFVSVPMNSGIVELMVDSTVWTSVDGDLSGAGSASVESFGAPCTSSDTSGGRTPFPSQHCRTASFKIAVNFTLQSQVVSIASQTLNGMAIDSLALQSATTIGKVRWVAGRLR